MIEATVREAHLMAELVGEFLEAIGLAPSASERKKKPAEFPRQFLWELGFVLRLWTWERRGIRELLAPICRRPAGPSMSSSCAMASSPGRPATRRPGRGSHSA